MVDPLRDFRIDLMKAICIVLVVVWHFQPITPQMLPSNGAWALWSANALKFFYLNVTLLAVPTFILLSLYLFFGKATVAQGYWKKRLLRLVQVFLFWVCIQFMLYVILGGKLPPPVQSIIPGGGPDLPLWGPSIFYYLFILIVCTVLAAVFLKLPEGIKIFVSVMVVLLSLVHFGLSPLYGISIDTRAMEGYYIYIPLAYYLSRYKDQLVRYRALFLGAFLLSLIAEWGWTGMGSAYGRWSVFFGSLSFVLFVLSSRGIANGFVSFLAKYSLGIFALHIYAYKLCVRLSVVLKSHLLVNLPFVMESALVFSAAVALTLLSVYLLGKTKWRMYVA